jgi:FdhD protein
MKQTNNLTLLTDLPMHPLHQAQLSEAPVAISVNGISQAVMMASPDNLQDFALGFALSEGLIHGTQEVLDVVVQAHENGWQVDLQVLGRTIHQLKKRRRTMAGPSGCGLCGVDSIQAAMQLNTEHSNQPNKVIISPSLEVIMQAKNDLPKIIDDLGGKRGNHSATYFDLTGQLIAHREDVGRHSALDKLLGCLSSNNQLKTAGFVLMTSRCSHDLVAKVTRLSLTTLVTLAQPTTLAVESARKTKLILFCFQQKQLKRFA